MFLEWIIFSFLFFFYNFFLVICVRSATDIVIKITIMHCTNMFTIDTTEDSSYCPSESKGGMYHLAVIWNLNLEFTRVKCRHWRLTPCLLMKFVLVCIRRAALRRQAPCFTVETHELLDLYGAIKFSFFINFIYFCNDAY